MKKKKNLPLKDLEKIILEVCEIKDQQTTAMLDFYHDLGVIVKHGNTVVLKAEWLIDLFRKLITIRPYDEQNPVHSQYWSTLEKTGVLQLELVDHVFKEIIENGETKEDILAMMEHYGLIARFRRAGDTDNFHYFVPAQLKSSPEGLLDVEPSPSDPCALYIHFLDGFIPHGLYYCLVSKMIAWCSDDKKCPDEPKLFRSGSLFFVGDPCKYEMNLVCRRRFIKIVLKSRSMDIQDASSARDHLENCLQETKDQCHWYRFLRYEISVLCTLCSRPKKKCDKHQVQGCTDDDCLHLVQVTKDRVDRLFCTETFDIDKKFEVRGLEDWYREHPIAAGGSEESVGGPQAEPESQMCPSSKKSTRKRKKPEDIILDDSKLFEVAEEVNCEWKVLGRVLKIKEHKLKEIEHDYKPEGVREQAYQMLFAWRESFPDDCNLSSLSNALVKIGLGLVARQCCME